MFTTRQKLFCLSLLDILDNIGKTIRPMDVGKNNIIILHWSAASYIANSSNPLLFTKLALLIQNVGITMNDDIANGSVNLKISLIYSDVGF